MTYPRTATRRVFRLVNGGTPTAEEGNWGGDIAWATPIDLALFNGSILGATERRLTEQGLATGSRAVGPDSLIVSTRAPIGYVSQTVERTAFNQGCRGLEPQGNIDLRYFRYQFSAMTTELQSGGQGSTFSELTTEALGSFAVALPPLSAQRAIADFLDTETARVDALITKKRRMIELLRLRHGATIRARLLELDAPILPLKRRWSVIDCKHTTPTYVESGYPVVSPGDATPGRLDLSRAHRFVDEFDYQRLADGVRRPQRGDIIYSRNASIGIAAFVDTDDPFCMGQDVCLITSREQSQLFLTYALNTLGLDQLDEQKVGSTFSRVNISQIVELAIPCPSPEMQAHLAAELDAASAQVARAERLLTCQIDLLVEHRQALITAAVTGEMEIPGLAA